MPGQEVPVQKNINQKSTMKKNNNLYGFFNDPPGAKCPYCGETNKLCSYLNGMNRAWGRMVCEKNHKEKNN